MLSCLKVKDTSAIGILVFELFIFLHSWIAQLHRKQIYLVSETENIDQKHVLLREDKHASFIPHCQFSLWQKALESTTSELGALR